MGSKTRILHLEDNPADSELLAGFLREAGIDTDIVRVSSRGTFLAALEAGGFDLVVSDYSIPAFDGLAALGELRSRHPELAFIFFTGTLGEDRAVDAMRAGAADFVAKGRPDRVA